MRLLRLLLVVEEPGIGPVANNGRQVRSGKPVERFHGEALPGATDLGDGFDEAGDGAKELGGAGAGERGEFAVGDEVAVAVVASLIAGAEGVVVSAIAADQSIDGIELRVAEETDPQLEI